jgi:hypothetical protein
MFPPVLQKAKEGLQAGTKFTELLDDEDLDTLTQVDASTIFQIWLNDGGNVNQSVWSYDTWGTPFAWLAVCNDAEKIVKILVGTGQCNWFNGERSALDCCSSTVVADLLIDGGVDRAQTAVGKKWLEEQV